MSRNEETDELREAIAAIQHAIWAHWMKYQFQMATKNQDGTYTIPADLVARWKRQMDAPYDRLSDREQESDRHQAHKVIEVLGDRCYFRDIPWDDIASVTNAVLDWSQPPMEEYDTAVTVNGWLEKVKAQGAKPEEAQP